MNLINFLLTIFLTCKSSHKQYILIQMLTQQNKLGKKYLGQAGVFESFLEIVQILNWQSKLILLQEFSSKKEG